MTDRFTPTEQAILELLSDGMPHPRDEVKRLLPDDLADARAIAVHVCNLRRKIGRVGQDIIFTIDRRRKCYRLVRMLASPYDGRS